ncbi:flagellar biosynthesis protein FlhF [Comamonas sp. lk]|uniref:flagellar biosynthesis protein FlhF n=1 Tax=Comamonas sp. lk TaxID=2201272 RepID=UPI000EAEDF67|nr:flagellar biosynthesis protein FlhF [Comamonas sp. lk]
MNIKRFYAPTSREALAKARMAFGEGTLILSNRQTPEGVEVMATAEDDVQPTDAGSPLRAAIERRAIDEPRDFRSKQRFTDQDFAPVSSQKSALAATASSASPSSSATTAAPAKPAMSTLEHVLARQAAKEAAPEQASTQASVQDDVEQLSMSTLSFQDYVRERMLRRRHEASLSADEPLPTFAQRTRAQNEAARPAQFSASRPAQPSAAAPIARHNPLRSEPIVVKPSTATAAVAASASPQGLMQEMQSMKDLLEERFNTLTWLGQTRQNPIQSSLMHKLICAGYSPVLSRALIEKLPETLSAGDALRWLMQVLERNLRTDAAQDALYDRGGVYALVGATGVGKTTTTAKLAALCAARHGAASVGLITLDTYRIGGHEQLRSYARMLGMVAHQAHDKAALQDLLGLLQNKKIVLIDTTGVAPRDPRKDEIIDVLDIEGVQQLLAVNAAAQGDAQDDVIRAFKARGSQHAILTKVDEAVKIGPSVDSLIRHQMQLCGVTNGQRVPEDWERANSQALASASMRATAPSAFDPEALDLDFFFTPAAPQTAEAAPSAEPTETDQAAQAAPVAQSTELAETAHA